jgi:hypothetical protein
MGSQAPSSTRPLNLCEERKRYEPSPLLLEFNHNRGRRQAWLLAADLRNRDGPGTSSSSEIWQGHLQRASLQKLQWHFDFPGKLP